MKKVFLKILQNSQENTRVRDPFLINDFIKKESLAQVFSCEFAKFLRTPFFTEHLYWLLLANVLLLYTLKIIS